MAKPPRRSNLFRSVAIGAATILIAALLVRLVFVSETAQVDLSSGASAVSIQTTDLATGALAERSSRPAPRESAISATAPHPRQIRVVDWAGRPVAGLACLIRSRAGDTHAVKATSSANGTAVLPDSIDAFDLVTVEFPCGLRFSMTLDSQDVLRLPIDWVRISAPGLPSDEACEVTCDPVSESGPIDEMFRVVSGGTQVRLGTAVHRFVGPLGVTIPALLGQEYRLAVKSRNFLLDHPQRCVAPAECVITVGSRKTLLLVSLADGRSQKGRLRVASKDWSYSKSIEIVDGRAVVFADDRQPPRPGAYFLTAVTEDGILYRGSAEVTLGVNEHVLEVAPVQGQLLHANDDLKSPAWLHVRCDGDWIDIAIGALPSHENPVAIQRSSRVVALFLDRLWQRAWVVDHTGAGVFENSGGDLVELSPRVSRRVPEELVARYPDVAIWDLQLEIVDGEHPPIGKTFRRWERDGGVPLSVFAATARVVPSLRVRLRGFRDIDALHQDVAIVTEFL